MDNYYDHVTFASELDEVGTFHPDAEYVRELDVRLVAGRDPADAEWDARVLYERVVDADLAELNAQAAEQRRLAQREERAERTLIVLNRKTNRVTVKGGVHKRQASRVYPTTADATERFRAIQDWLARRGEKYRVWVPA